MKVCPQQYFPHTRVAHDVRVNLIEEEALADSGHNWASSKISRTNPQYNCVHPSIQAYEAKGGLEPSTQGDVICTNNEKPIPVKTVALLSTDPFLHIQTTIVLKIFLYVNYLC